VIECISRVLGVVCDRTDWSPVQEMRARQSEQYQICERRSPRSIAEAGTFIAPIASAAMVRSRRRRSRTPERVTLNSSPTCHPHQSSRSRRSRGVLKNTGWGRDACAWASGSYRGGKRSVRTIKRRHCGAAAGTPPRTLACLANYCAPRAG